MFKVENKDVYDKLIDKFIDNLVGRIAFYTTITQEGCKLYRTSLRFGTTLNVGQVTSISREVDKAIEDSLRLLMKDEILDVLNMTYRELGISTKKEK